MRVISVLALGLLGPGSVLASVCKLSPVSSATPPSSSISSLVSSSASSSISISSSVPSSSSASSSASSTSSSASAQPTCDVNILSNGNFVSTDDWAFVDVTGAGLFTTETDGPAGYSNYLKYATTAAGTSYMYTTLTTVPGTTYSLDYAYECTSDIGITGIHAQLSQGAIWVQSVTVTNGWTSGLSGTFTATDTTTTLTFTFSCNEYLTVGFTNIGVSAVCETVPSSAATHQTDPDNSSQEGPVDELRHANGGAVNVTVSSGRPNAAGNGSGSNTPGGIVVTSIHVLQRTEGNGYAGYAM